MHLYGTILVKFFVTKPFDFWRFIVWVMITARTLGGINEIISGSIINRFCIGVQYDFLLT